MSTRLSSVKIRKESNHIWSGYWDKAIVQGDWPGYSEGTPRDPPGCPGTLVGTLLLFGAMPSQLGFFDSKFMPLYMLISVSGALAVHSAVKV